jgi:hypothetical protein
MAIEIRSYRSVFDLERRIYQVDRLRLNPGGVPLRGAVYCLALLLLVLLVAALPLLGALVRVLPWYVRDLAGPVGGAALLSAIRVDGRPFHQAAWALVSYAAGPRVVLGDRSAHLAGRRWRPGEMVVLPDGSEGRLRRLRCTGPAAVRVNVAHERVEWRRGGLLPGRAGRGRRGRVRVAVRELPGRRAPRRGHAIVLHPGARLRVLGAGAGSRVSAPRGEGG